MENFNLNNKNKRYIPYGMFIGEFLVFIGLAVFVIQLIGYLKFGDWDSCSLVYCWFSVFNFTLLDIYIDWAGVYKILDFLPLALIIALVGFCNIWYELEKDA